MNGTREEAFRKENKSVVSFIRKLPSLIRWFLYIFSYLIIIVISYWAGKNNFNPKNFLVIVGFNNKVEGMNSEGPPYPTNTCVVKYCSDFKDGLWQYEDRFVTIQKDPLILKSPNTQALPGATMFFKNSVGDFTANITIIPEATVSANLAVAWGHFIRCIIGDGDYSKISCQVNTSYPKEIESWSYFDKEGILYGKSLQYQLSPFVVDQELQLKFEIEGKENSKLIRLKLNDHVPIEWKIPNKYSDKSKTEKVGVGLFTTEFDDVQAVFKNFQLDPHF